MTEDMVKADMVTMAAIQVVLMATFIKQNSCKWRNGIEISSDILIKKNESQWMITSVFILLTTQACYIFDSLISAWAWASIMCMCICQLFVFFTVAQFNMLKYIEV